MTKQVHRYFWDSRLSTSPGNVVQQIVHGLIYDRVDHYCLSATLEPLDLDIRWELQRRCEVELRGAA